MLLLPVCLEAQQHPGSEPIHFYGSFSGRGNFSVTLADAVSPEYVNPMIVTNCPPGWLDTPEATAFLVPFQTYEIVVQADAVYSYQVELKPPSLSELMDGNSAGSSSNKRYLIYIFQGSSWVKLCDANPIAFNTDTELGYTDCVSHNRTYQIQIRPDLGARPLTRLSAPNG